MSYLKILSLVEFVSFNLKSRLDTANTEVDSMIISALIKNYFCVYMLQNGDDINMNSVSI